MRPDWWLAFYDEWYQAARLSTYTAAAAAEARDTAARVRDLLELTPGDRVFDQCCGAGRLSIPLASDGLDVVGVDACAAYVERAATRAARAGVPVAAHLGDAFTFVPPGPACDAAFNWATSFGYARDDATNAQMLARAFDALRPGGRFALDYANIPRVLRRLRPSFLETYATPRGPLRVRRESVLDRGADTLVQRWTFTAEDGRAAIRDGAIRLYGPRNLTRLLEAVGFRDIQVLGSVDGEPWEEASPRCVCTAIRR